MVYKGSWENSEYCSCEGRGLLPFGVVRLEWTPVPCISWSLWRPGDLQGTFHLSGSSMLFTRRSITIAQMFGDDVVSVLCCRSLTDKRQYSWPSGDQSHYQWWLGAQFEHGPSIDSTKQLCPSQRCQSSLQWRLVSCCRCGIGPLRVCFSPGAPLRLLALDFRTASSIVCHFSWCLPTVAMWMASWGLCSLPTRVLLGACVYGLH